MLLRFAFAGKQNTVCNVLLFNESLLLASLPLFSHFSFFLDFALRESFDFSWHISKCVIRVQ